MIYKNYLWNVELFLMWIELNWICLKVYDCYCFELDADRTVAVEEWQQRQ
jgi:hypothetical protein